MRPLYRELAEAKLDRNHGNAGLWYDKYCNQWCNDPEKTGLARWSLEAFKDKNPKLEWIREVASKIIGEQTLLSEAADRRARLLRAHDQTPLFFETDWHFVTGLGREHPIENGFAWHYSLGVPYLPGSSVKGMVRAWAENWLDPKPSDDVLRWIFGPRGDAARKSPASGSVIFLDAIPTKPVTLKADIMTPHYGPYYQDPSRNPPADWYSPTPIPFLVVAPETTFQFGLLPRRQQDAAYIKTVQGWLREALNGIGAGAKTAVGYGRMDEDPAAEKEYQQRLQEIDQQRLAQQERARWARMTAQERQIEVLRKLFDDPATRVDDRRKQQLVQLREQLLKDALKWSSHADRVAAADLLEAIYNSTNWGNEAKKQERQAAIVKLCKPIPG